MPTSAPIKLLLVDDNDTNRYALSRMLSQKGVDVTEAKTGCEALRCARSSPHLMLMDIHLPDMTAYEVLERLRADSGTKELPVVLMSAVEPAPQARSMAQALGVHSFLTVPVLSDDLWIVVQATLRKRLNKIDRPA